MSLKTLPEQEWSNETEGKDAEEHKHQDPHLALVLFIPYVSVDACLVRTNTRFSGEFDRAEANSTMFVGLDFPCCRGHNFVGHSLQITLHFICVNHVSSPKVKSMFHQTAVHQALSRAGINPGNQVRPNEDHKPLPSPQRQGQSLLMPPVQAAHRCP